MADSTTCAVCAHAGEHGYWGDTIPANFTHCRDCHVTFPASNRWGHCSGCHQTFSGAESFDLHQRITGDGDIASDCLCAVAMSTTVEESLLGESHQPKWGVGSKTLTLKRAEWGSYWGQPAPTGLRGAS
jgi:hypothetical protein